MPDCDPERPRQPDESAGLPRRPPHWRTVLGLLVAGGSAPLLVLLFMLGPMALLSLAQGHLPGAESQAFGAFMFFAMAAMMFGGPTALAVTVVVGLPGVWLARRLGRTSGKAFAAGGAGAGAAAFVGISAARSTGPDIGDWVMVLPFACAGAASALLYWAIAERPFPQGSTDG